jgi:hypothetical protein
MPEGIRDLGPLGMTLTLEAYQNYWKKANENVSCYPSTLSFSTMKAGAFDEQISKVDWALTVITLEYGFAPSQLKQRMDVMILKRSGVAELSGLRTMYYFLWIVTLPLSTLAGK